MSDFREHLPYIVILSRELVVNETIEWCKDQIGERWKPSGCARNGKWTGHAAHLPDDYSKVMFAFANEKDAIVFKLRWS